MESIEDDGTQELNSDKLGETKTQVKGKEEVMQKIQPPIEEKTPESELSKKMEYRHRESLELELNSEPTSKEKVMQGALFPHILKLIGKKMQVGELWTLRQTCKTWNKEFLPALREKQEFVEVDCIDFKAVARKMNGAVRTPDPTWYQHHHIPVRDFINLMKDPSSSTVPVSKYRLTDAHTRYAHPEDVAELFRVCGAFITRLEISADRDSWYDDGHGHRSGFSKTANINTLRKIVFEHVPNLSDLHIGSVDLSKPDPVDPSQPIVAARDLPNLRRLKLCALVVITTFFNGAHEQFDFDLEIYPTYISLFVDLMHHAKELKTLELLPGPIEAEMSLLPALLRNDMPQDRIGMLKTLKIYQLESPELRILAELASRRENPLRLESLFMCIVYPYDGSMEALELLYWFLESQSDTLGHLGLKIQFYEPDLEPQNPLSFIAINFPILPAVHTLSLNRGYNWSHWAGQPAQPLEYSFPSLVNYEYLGVFSGLSTNGKPGFGHHGASLTALTLDTSKTPAVRFRETCGTMFHLQAVTRLDIKLSGNVVLFFQQICSMMPALELLRVTLLGINEEDEDGDDYENGNDCEDGNDCEEDGDDFKDGDDCEDGDDYEDEDDRNELDDFLTGVPKNKLGGLQSALDLHIILKPGALTVATLRNILEEYKTQPGLQDLRFLKKLEIISTLHGRYSRQYHLTNLGGYFGLALASSTIQHIRIAVGCLAWSERKKHKIPGNLVSPNCETLIKSVMALPAVLSFH